MMAVFSYMKRWLLEKLPYSFDASMAPRIKAYSFDSKPLSLGHIMMFVKLRQPLQEELPLHQGFGELLGKWILLELFWFRGLGL